MVKFTKAFAGSTFDRIKDYEKKCFYCGKCFVQKYGFIKDVQRYKCQYCGKQFLGRK